MEKENQNQLMASPNEYNILEQDEFDKYLLELPEALEADDVKKLLMELPSRLLFIQHAALNFKKRIGDLKVTLDTKKRLLDYEKSEIRSKELKKYELRLKEFREKSEEIMKTALNTKGNDSLKKTYIQEMLKVYTPTKPTRLDLDDIANQETRYLQIEIDELEEQIKDLTIELEEIKIKEKFYENAWLSVRSYKGIVVEEMRNAGK